MRPVLWTLDGTLLEEAVVPAGTGGLAVDFFLYVEIDPTVLMAGQQYVLGSRADDTDDPGDSYIVSFNQGQASSAAEVTWVAARQTTTFAFGFPSQDPATFPQIHYFGPNFLFDPVPEPSTALLLGFGLVAMAAHRRA